MRWLLDPSLAITLVDDFLFPLKSILKGDVLWWANYHKNTEYITLIRHDYRLNVTGCPETARYANIDFSFYPLRLKPSSKGCFAVCTTVNARCKSFNKRCFSFFFGWGVVGGVPVGERIIGEGSEKIKNFKSSIKLKTSFTNSEEFYN